MSLRLFALVSFVAACASAPVRDEATVDLPPPEASPSSAPARAHKETIVTAPVTVAPKAEAPRDTSRAEQLFDEGRRAMADGDVPVACAKFRESLNADHALGTLLNLGACEEQLGRRSQACQAFREAQMFAAQRGQDERREFARLRADSLACPP